MKSGNKSIGIRKLAIAVAAMITMGGAASTALALDVTATQFVASLNTYIRGGDYAAAKAALERLSVLHVKQIKIGGKFYSIDDLIAALSNARLSGPLMAELLAELRLYGVAYFVTEDRVIASVDISPSAADYFPTGSAG